ncbi:hypothetical protein BDR03DRAFT_1001741 [Suillus americanus]|nr:hypothetical protein BDR03DRAFT_1001741 [Suillus americanus]
MDSKRYWKSAVRVLSSDGSVTWDDTVTLSRHPSTLGRGGVTGKLEMLWHELLELGDEPFDLYFSPIRDVQPSLTLKVAVVQTRGNPLLHVTYDLPNKNAVELTNVLEPFQFVLDQCPVNHPHRATALTDLAWVAFKGPLTAASIGETAQLYYELLPLCPEGTYLRSIAIGNNCVSYVIRQRNNLPIDVPDKGIHLRGIVLKLCQLGH